MRCAPCSMVLARSLFGAETWWTFMGADRIGSSGKRKRMSRALQLRATTAASAAFRVHGDLSDRILRRFASTSARGPSRTFTGARAAQRALLRERWFGRFQLLDTLAQR